MRIETYEELDEIISFEGFDFSHYYSDEKDVLKPRLENLGFFDICFVMGESDSFGPLTRICFATDQEGKRRRFIYG